MKLYQITGKRAVDRDIVLNVGDGQVAFTQRPGGSILASLPYKRFVHATYVRARDPKWDPSLSSPPEGFDAESGLGSIIRSARHWLVLQGTDHIEILRLEDNNFRQVLETFEARTGVKIDRK